MGVSPDEFGFTYGGVHSRMFKIKIIDIVRGWPTMAENNTDVPAVTGDIYNGTDVQSKPITVTAKICADSLQDLEQIRHQVITWLKPVDDETFELVFDDEPDITWDVHTTNIEIQRELYHGATTFTFSAPDPHGYKENRELYLNKDTNDPLVDVDVDNNIVTLHDPESTATSFPIFTCLPNNPIKESGIAVIPSDPEDDEGGFDWAYIGAHVDIDNENQIKDTMPLIVSDACNNLENWQQLTTNPACAPGTSNTSSDDSIPPVNLPTFAIENGVIGKGAYIEATSQIFQAKRDSKGRPFFGDYLGLGFRTPWHGAGVIHTPFNVQMDNWKINVCMENISLNAAKYGKTELYLLDQFGLRMGKIMVEDAGDSRDQLLSIQIGTHEVHKEMFTIAKYPRKARRPMRVYVEDPHTGKRLTKTVRGKRGRKKTVASDKRTSFYIDNSSVNTYSQWYGALELTKAGNVYTASIQRFRAIDTQAKDAIRKLPRRAGISYTKRVFTYTDNRGLLNGKKLSNVAMYIAKHDINADNPNNYHYYPENRLSINWLKIWNILQPDIDEWKSQTVADQNDQIMFDSEDLSIKVNKQLSNHRNAGSNLSAFRLNGSSPKTYSFVPSLSEATWILTHRSAVD